MTISEYPCLPVPTKHDNCAILQDLERQRDLLTIGCYAAGVGALAGVAFFSPLVPASMPPLAIMLGKLQAISQQVMLMRRLIEAFEAEEIEIHPRLELPTFKQIDFFLKFPDKRFILIHIASMGNSIVSFNENTERLQFRKRGGGLKNWEPDPLLVIHSQQDWVRRNRRDLMGGSSKDARRPIAKIFVLWGATTLADDHNEHLYSTMASYRALWIKKFGATCIVQEDQVIEAIKAYLASQREQ
jgi:hypothetical protein